MSLSASTVYGMEGTAAWGSKSSGAVPRLATGAGYALWAPLFAHWCNRHAAGAVLRQEIKGWPAMVTLVEQWETERTTALLEEMTLVSAGGAISSSSSSSSSDSKAAAAAAAATEAKQAALRKLVSDSQRVYAVLFDALSEELRAQVPGPDGYAFGLWDWLRTKFQNTEADSIGMLWRQWGLMQMQVDETYDAYRARVSKLRALLEAAKEPVTPIHFADVMVGRLLPQYQAVVLALKSSEKLKEPSKVNWDEVAAAVNAFERTEQRAQGGGAGDGGVVDQQAMSLQGSWKNGGGKRGLAHTRCFNCGKTGHFARDCGRPETRGGNNETANAAMQGATGLYEEDEDLYAFSAVRAARPSETVEAAAPAGAVGESEEWATSAEAGGLDAESQPLSALIHERRLARSGNGADRANTKPGDWSAGNYMGAGDAWGRSSSESGAWGDSHLHSGGARGAGVNVKSGVGDASSSGSARGAGVSKSADVAGGRSSTAGVAWGRRSVKPGAGGAGTKSGVGDASSLKPAIVLNRSAATESGVWDASGGVGDAIGLKSAAVPNRLVATWKSGVGDASGAKSSAVPNQLKAKEEYDPQDWEF